MRSFLDSNGDGIGDFKGLTSRLDYINDGDPRSTNSLGANCIWLMPVAKSPSYHGYDVTDYYHVNPEYGTDADFRELVREAHKRSIKVLVDFVPNHTSSQHPAFQAALRDTASSFRQWYRWSRTKPSQPGTWQQEVWHRSPVREEYYYGLFWGGMPDLNYENPATLREMKKVEGYWLREMGVDGFRIDAASHLIEHGDTLQHADGTHAVLRELADAAHRVSPDAFTIGEVTSDSASILARYYPDQLDSYFAFGVARATLSAARTGSAAPFVDAIREAKSFFPPGRWAPFLTNHDQPRVMTQLGSDAARAKIAAIAMLTLPGTPFVYYGEEIGMIGDKPDEQIRTPMQWTSAANGGFSRAKPWEDLQKDWRDKSVESQERDTESLLTLYRSLIHLRLAHRALSSGDIELLDSADPHVAAFVRHSEKESFIVVLNFGEQSIAAAQVGIPKAASVRLSFPTLTVYGPPGIGHRPSGPPGQRDVTFTDLMPHQGYILQVVR